MTQFDDLFAAAASPSLAQMFGETIVYRPLVGPPRTIIGAIVNRNPPERTVPNGILNYSIEIEVPNDSTVGISSAEVDTGGDLVDVAPRQGVPLETRPIASLISDGGMLLLGIG